PPQLMPRTASAATPAWWEQAFVIVTLFLTSGAGTRLASILTGQAGIGRSEINMLQGDSVMQPIWLGMYAIAVILLWRHHESLVITTRRSILLGLLVGFAFLSFAWSEVPTVTLRRAFALAGTTFIGIYIASRFDIAGVARMLLWVTGIAALLSLVFAVALPTYGIASEGPTIGWQGIFGQKNWLGRMMAFSVIVWSLALLDRRVPNWLSLGMLALSLLLIGLSASATALVLLLAIPVSLLLARAIRAHIALAIPLCAVIVLSLLYVLAQFPGMSPAILAFLDRDTGLTGRDLLWEYLWKMVWEQPWLGYGYGGFWLGADGPSGDVWAFVNWRQPPSHAHNGYLDLLLNFGMLGAALFAMQFLQAVVRAVVHVRTTHGRTAMLPIMFLVFTLLSNISESNTVIHNSMFWILYVYLAVRAGAPFAPEPPAVSGAAPAAPLR
ncbi:MAG TPA: O-antigen ligase family protein, partial [Roseiflexaceae bacterium]|nr:O-antigen ligase family protein [Roseiflexaceae bacterium]